MQITASLLPTKDTSNVDMTLSVSKSKTFEDCKAKFKFCYIEKLPRIDRDFHIFGKYLHAVLEYFHEFLLEDPKLEKDWEPVLIKARDKAYEEFEDTLTGNQYKDAEKIIAEYRELLHEEGLPNIIANEKSFYINLNNKVLLNGFIDRIQMDPDGVLHVADYKTTKNPKYLDDYFQLITYSYALMLEDPNLKRIRASFILLRHKFDYLTQEYTREEVMPVAEKFLKKAYQIEEEKLWRPNPQFLCKYCDYQEHCKEGKDFLIKRGYIKTKPTVGVKSWT